MKTYTRTFELSSCHFNCAETYELYGWLQNAVTIEFHDVHKLILDCHGHNFKIEIYIAWDDGRDWAIADEKLTELVMHFNRKNLSVMDEFAGMRATTENFAVVLHQIIKAYIGQSQLCVSVYETPEIVASYDGDEDAD